MKWRDHIPVDPLGCHGKACIRGTRVMVSVVLESLAAGETPDDIARDPTALGSGAVVCKGRERTYALMAILAIPNGVG